MGTKVLYGINIYAVENGLQWNTEDLMGLSVFIVRPRFREEDLWNT